MAGRSLGSFHLSLGNPIARMTPLSENLVLEIIILAFLEPLPARRLIDTR